MAEALTPDEVRALPAAVPLLDAARALGIGRTKVHEMARSGELEALGLRLLRLGTRYRVRRCDLLDLLGIADTPPRNGDGPSPPDEGPVPDDNPDRHHATEESWHAA